VAPATLLREPAGQAAQAFVAEPVALR